MNVSTLSLTISHIYTHTHIHTQVLAGGVAPDSEATAGFAYWIRSADSVLPRPQAPAKAKKRASTPKNTSMQVPAKPSDPRCVCV